MTQKDEEPEDAFAMFGYEIDCPCGYVFFEEGDVRGEIIECPDCQQKLKVVGLGG